MVEIPGEENPTPSSPETPPQRSLLGRVADRLHDSVAVLTGKYLINTSENVIVGEEYGYVVGGDVLKGVAVFESEDSSRRRVRGREIFFLDRN